MNRRKAIKVVGTADHRIDLIELYAEGKLAEKSTLVS